VPGARPIFRPPRISHRPPSCKLWDTIPQMMRRRPGGARRRGRGWRRARLPLAAWILPALLALAATNFAVQVIRKPSELLGLVVPTAAKSPAETWSEYGPLFRDHATEVITPALLAALVQVESAGDPLARTFWRWRWTANPFRIWAPASSAVGILQITDGTFAQARHYCIHDHAVARDGAWLDPRACWFNALYVRSVPSHSIEMTSAWLHQGVAETLARRRAPPQDGDRQRLAAVIHLCGRERGAAFAARSFRVRPGERCGEHDLRAYLARVGELAAAFERLADAG